MKLMTYDPKLLYRAALNYLPQNKVREISRKSIRQFYRWAASPSHCDQTSVNPHDTLKMIYEALDDVGKGDVARADVDALARVLAGRFCDDVQSMNPVNLHKAVSDIVQQIGVVAAQGEQAIEDGILDAQEQVQLRARIRELKERVSVLDAIFKTGMYGAE